MKQFIYHPANGVAFLLCLFLLTDCTRDVQTTAFEKVEPRYIAHAGGKIDGFTYTNSLEAVQNAINNGIKFIELDLALTEDSVLVCAHDWEVFNHYLLGRKDYKEPLSFAEFRQCRLLGKYTPMTAQMIVDIWLEHPDLWLVTDKISTPEIIEKYFTEIKDRMVVECFSYSDYRELSGLGYVTYLSGWPPRAENATTEQGGGKNDRFVFHTGCDLTKYYFDRCALFTCENTVQADSLLRTDRRIDLVYVDDITR